MQPNAIEKIFLGLLNNYNPEHLNLAVRQKISIANLIVQFLPPVMLKTIRLAASLYRNQGNVLSTENMINYLELTRPDLANIFKSSLDSKRWLNKQIVDIKRLFGLI
jgi:hypothetical protein